MQAHEVRWGILGPGAIAKAFVSGVKHASAGRVTALGSRSLEKARAFAADNDLPEAACHGSYDALLADGNVDVVYIATPHPMHAEWVIKSAESGKHVFCEKPAGVNHAEVMAMVEACREHGVFFMEAFKDRCHPQSDRLAELLREQAIGDLRLIYASFCFDMGDNIDPDSRLFSPALAGGGILDVGCYPVQLVRRIVGVATGQAFADPTEVTGCAHIGETGVDEWAAATFKFDSGTIAQISTGIRANSPYTLRIEGTRGSLVVPDPWNNSREHAEPGRIELTRDGQTEVIEVPSELSSFGYEASHAAQAIAEGQTQSDAMSWDDSLGQARTLDRWRHAIKLQYPRDTPEGFAAPIHGRPLRRRDGHPMRYGRVEGVDRDISKLIMGCDNQMAFSHAAVMFDDWWERGGNAFDTAHLYHGGLQERLLGQWLKSRGVRDEAVILAKGCHTPWNTPEFMPVQLAETLDRLQTDRVEVYLLHRDNPDIPAGEFIDVMHAEAEAGRIGAFGGSNWSIARISEANAYAEAHGKRKMTVASNNFSLARMVKPVWDGCVAASDPESAAYLQETQIANFAWSSQARGYFVSPDALGMRTQWEADGPFDSEDNRERRRRAFELADAKGCTAINIAAAYVLGQPFPSFALIGPREIRETATSTPALGLELTPQELAYLDLRADTPA